MANNGRLVPSEKGFRGTIATMQFRMDVTLTPNPRHVKDNADSPTWLVEARGTHGDLVEVGAAWVKRIERGDHRGESFMSITIDDPSLPGPLNVSAFLREGGVFDITWNRPRPEGRAGA